ncbi:hypothetical protein BJ170DRAFT_693521 [Xylariales sp. AK1849]|nr:hypothetical protein BJ170DRAFT_693521 [Xylariales sp. AK1849]
MTRLLFVLLAAALLRTGAAAPAANDLAKPSGLPTHTTGSWPGLPFPTGKRDSLLKPTGKGKGSSIPGPKPTGKSKPSGKRPLGSVPKPSSFQLPYTKTHGYKEMLTQSVAGYAKSPVDERQLPVPSFTIPTGLPTGKGKGPKPTGNVQRAPTGTGKGKGPRPTGGVSAPPKK